MFHGKDTVKIRVHTYKLGSRNYQEKQYVQMYIQYSDTEPSKCIHNHRRRQAQQELVQGERSDNIWLNREAHQVRNYLLLASQNQVEHSLPPDAYVPGLPHQDQKSRLRMQAQHAT